MARGSTSYHNYHPHHGNNNQYTWSDFGQFKYKTIREGDDDPKIDMDFYRALPSFQQAARESVGQPGYQFSGEDINYPLENYGDLERAQHWMATAGERAAAAQAKAQPAPVPAKAPQNLAPTPLSISGAEAPVQGPPAQQAPSPSQTPAPTQWSFGNRRSTQGVATGKTFDPLSKRQSIMGSRGAFNRGGLRISSLNI